MPLYHHLPSFFFITASFLPSGSSGRLFFVLGFPLDNYDCTTFFVICQYENSKFCYIFLRIMYCKNTNIVYNSAWGDYMIKFRVKVMLAMRELTQKELAEKTGVRPPTVSAICTGTAKHIPVNVLDAFCKVLHCQPGDLMEYVEEENDSNDERKGN